MATQTKVVRVLVEGTANGAFAVTAESPLVIGRGEDATLRLLDRCVSRTHLKIALGEGGLEAEDLESANGTFVRVNGQAAVTAGDLLLVGEQILRIDPA